MSVAVDFYQERRNGSIIFFRWNNVTSPEGLFYCKIPLTSGEEEHVYVGLYLEGNGELFLKVQGGRGQGERKMRANSGGRR